jgi:hypothetical protein
MTSERKQQQRITNPVLMQCNYLFRMNTCHIAGQHRDSAAQKLDLSTGNGGEIRARREGKIRGGTVRGTLPAGVLAVHIEARKARGNMGQLRRFVFWQCPASVPEKKKARLNAGLSL